MIAEELNKWFPLFHGGSTGVTPSSVLLPFLVLAKVWIEIEAFGKNDKDSYHGKLKEKAHKASDLGKRSLPRLGWAWETI